MRVELNKKWLIKASRKMRIKKVRLRTKMIRFQEIKEKQVWGLDHMTDHMTIILHKLHDHDITKELWL